MRITTALRLASACFGYAQQPKYSATEILSNREHWSLIFAHRAKSKGNSDKPQCPSDRNRTDSNKSFKSISCVIWNKSVRFLAKRLLQKNTEITNIIVETMCTSSLQMPLRLQNKKGTLTRVPLIYVVFKERLLLDETSVLAVY